MANKFKTILLLLFSLLVFTNCEEKDDPYFDEPDWLVDPLYTILEQEGNFTSYLACVDRTLYAGQIKEGGYITLMAPNDDAFKAFMAANGYSSIDEIPQEEVEKIVGYSIVESYWKSENLGDVFKGTVDDRYEVGAAVKRRTMYYPTIYRDPEFDNKWVIDEYSSSGKYKHMPVFMNSYFSLKKLTESDYKTFYPNSTFVVGQSVATGEIGNVGDGQIVKPNMLARNGVAHEVSTVNYPMEKLDKFLSEGEAYKQYKELMDLKDMAGTYYYKAYYENVTLTETYKILRPNDNIDKVYMKGYLTGEEYMYFSPAYEVYIDGNGANASEEGGYTMFVPRDDVLRKYINEKLLKYYDTKSILELPTQAVTTLINSHIADGMVWPSQLSSSQVSTGEYINGEGKSGIGFDNFGVNESKIASNGFIYTIDHVIKSRLFETVYAEIFLNPAFSWLNQAFINNYNNSIREDLMKSVITGFPENRYTVLLISDNQWKADGYTYNSTTNAFANSLVVSSTAGDRMKRLMMTHLFEGYVKGDIDSEVTFANPAYTDYGGWGFRTTKYGDVIRYKDNQLQASGNIEENNFVNITKGESYDNGTAYTMDKPLQYSLRETSPGTKEGWNSNTLWYYLQQTAKENTNVRNFVEYIQYSLKAQDSDALTGVSEDNNYTIIMPNNTAITTAVRNGDLPSIDLVKAGDAGAIEQAMVFCRAHILQGSCLVDDKLPYLYPYNVNSPTENIISTMYRINYEPMKLVNQRTNIRVTKDASGKIVFTPMNVILDGATVVVGSHGATGNPDLTRTKPTVLQGGGGNNGYRSNRICGRAIHHEYNNYFKFTIQE